MNNDSNFNSGPLKVLVHLWGTQTTSVDIKDSNEVKEEGKLYEKAGFYYVVTPNARYKFNHRLLEVVRNGDVTTKMHFEAGKDHATLYDTPAGSFNFLFRTFQYSFTSGQDCWMIEVDYEIQERDVKISTNQIKILVRLNEAEQ